MDRNEIEEILFETAEGIDTPDAREAFFSVIRDGDPACADRLRGLLELNVRARRFFREAEIARTVIATQAGDEWLGNADPKEWAATPQDEKPGGRIGRYRLEKRIGEGGCGIVYLAEQIEPIRREVALKVIRLGMDTERVVARFETERQSLALMNHPNIARVLDGGATETGRPFFVMEWVKGARITEFCDTMRLTLRQRIDLFIEVCSGIQHAHQKGIIHRDIKPSNVLVSDENGKPTPKVIDFGVAKAITSAGNPGSTSATLGEPFVGTPAYMSPEQADRKEHDIDTRSDLYSLGILLYELLVGRPPFDLEELASAGITELGQILIERDRPSALALLSTMEPEELRQVSDRRSTDPSKLINAIRGDLNSVVMKAIEKDRRLRYETVNGLILDLQRHLNHAPVLARPQSRLYLARKFIRRNQITVGAAAAIGLSLCLGLGVAFSFYLKEREAREEQARLHKVAETAHASELQRFAEARGWEEFAHVSLLLSEGKTQEADERLRLTPLSSIQLSAQSTSVLRSLGNWNAIRGRWQQATECFQMLVKADALNHGERLVQSLDLIAIGSALIESGHLSDYGEFRQWSIGRFSENTSDLDVSRLLHSVLLVPADEEDLARMDRLKPILQNTEFRKDHVKDGWDREAAIWRAFGLAILEYRQENFAAALQWTEVAKAFHPSRDYINAALDPIHAMASFRLGDTSGARNTLERMRKRIDKAFAPDLPAAYEPHGEYQGFWWDWIIGRVLFREAENLIGSRSE